MDYVRLGSTGLKVSRLCLGCMTYGSKKWRDWVLDEDESRPFFRRALEAGINFFDTADMYSRRRERRGHRARAEGLRRARPRRHRHQGLQPDGRRPQPARPLAQAHPPRHRRQPAPPRHRLRRSLPDPPLRLRHADRRDDARAGRCRTRRQGALHRRVQHVRLAVRQDAGRFATRTDWRASSPCRITTTWSIAKKSARCCRCAARKASA